jgi:hypothetical protein
MNKVKMSKDVVIPSIESKDVERDYLPSTLSYWKGHVRTMSTIYYATVNGNDISGNFSASLRRRDKRLCGAEVSQKCPGPDFDEEFDMQRYKTNHKS